MKNSTFCSVIYTAVFVLLGQIVYAQNTFPTTGKVGIGTTAPQNNLQVVDGSGLPQMKLSYNDTTYADIKVKYDGSLYFSPSSGRTYFSSDGKSNSFYAFDLASDPNGATYFSLTANRLQLITAGVAKTDINSNGSSLFNGGNVGIGTTSPETKLHINESANIPASLNIPGVLIEGYNGWGSGISLQNTTANKSFGMYVSTNGNWHFTDRSNNLDRLFISSTGSVGIGTTSVNNDYKLFVDKGIRTRKIRVDQLNWPDYVFSPSYNLRSLSSLEDYIKQYNHLPDVPSAKDVETDGVDVGATQAVLLKKIEELTLYVIEQDKRIQEQHNAIQKLQEDNK